MNDNNDKLAIFFLAVCVFSLFSYFANKSPAMLMISLLSGYFFFKYLGNSSGTSKPDETLQLIFSIAAILILGWWLCRETASQSPEFAQCCAGPPLGMIIVANLLQKMRSKEPNEQNDIFFNLFKSVNSILSPLLRSKPKSRVETRRTPRL